MSVLVSFSRDGAWIGAILRGLRAQVAWGSSSRGGLLGMRGLLRDVRAGRSPVITLDGPLGPRHVAKAGAVALAAATGLPIVPLTFRFGSAWTLPRTWDQTVLPRPFTAARAIYGTPVFVARNADPAQGLAALQAAMDHVTAKAEAGERRTPIGKPRAKDRPRR
jgi:hypothetical protein